MPEPLPARGDVPRQALHSGSGGSPKSGAGRKGHGLQRLPTFPFSSLSGAWIKPWATGGEPQGQSPRSPLQGTQQPPEHAVSVQRFPGRGRETQAHRGGRHPHGLEQDPACCVPGIEHLNVAGMAKNYELARWQTAVGVYWGLSRRPGPGWGDERFRLSPAGSQLPGSARSVAIASVTCRSPNGSGSALIAGQSLIVTSTLPVTSSPPLWQRG